MPETWQDLQIGVARIFNEIGLCAEIEKKVQTPRGCVALDVFATDNASVDKIRYIVECKNWKNPIPQSVVHAFVMVMQEVGGNIGFIISRGGFQSGAIQYTQSTNITGMTYEDFQRRYFSVWFERCFVPEIGDSINSLVSYVEPFNVQRDRCVEQLSGEGKANFKKLAERHSKLGLGGAFFSYPKYVAGYEFPQPRCICSMNQYLNGLVGEPNRFSANCFRVLKADLLGAVRSATEEFNSLFGRDIFNT